MHDDDAPSFVRGATSGRRRPAASSRFFGALARAPKRTAARKPAHAVLVEYGPAAARLMRPGIFLAY
ncbi:hypothetical protein WS62_07130 [Burkholderia sp. ABCPW 14]|nr:hypothetical protein WS62_07130 [Burkholderia sp. ABCPW 14]